MSITFTVPGDPVPQPRPRISTAGGFARAYVPEAHPAHAYRQAVASELGRSGIGCELNPACIELAERRIAEARATAPLFT